MYIYRERAFENVSSIDHFVQTAIGMGHSFYIAVFPIIYRYIDSQ